MEHIVYIQYTCIQWFRSSFKIIITVVWIGFSIFGKIIWIIFISSCQNTSNDVIWKTKTTKKKHIRKMGCKLTWLRPSWVFILCMCMCVCCCFFSTSCCYCKLHGNGIVTVLEKAITTQHITFDRSSERWAAMRRNKNDVEVDDSDWSSISTNIFFKCRKSK